MVLVSFILESSPPSSPLSDEPSYIRLPDGGRSPCELLTPSPDYGREYEIKLQVNRLAARPVFTVCPTGAKAAFSLFFKI